MKYYYAILLLLNICPFLSSAQNNFKPGYVVDLKGDTTKGYIDYKEWEKNPGNITFKTLLATPAKTFSAADINAFGINRFEYFRSYTVKISQDQVELSNIKQGADTGFVTSHVFLRLLTQGTKITLLGYTDDIKARYYFINNPNETPQELVYRVFYSLENSASIETQNRFRIQLSYLALNNSYSDQIEQTIAKAQYNEADLVKVAQEINGDNTQQFVSKNRMGVRWFGGLGMTNNAVYFNGTIQYPNNNSIAPKIAAGFDLFPNNNTQKVFFRLELSRTGSTHSYSVRPDAGGSSYQLSKVIQHNYSIAPQVIYNLYNSDRLKFFLDAGVSFNISSYNDYSFSQNFTSSISVVTNEFPLFVKQWISLPFKSGIVIDRKIELYTGYTLKTTLTDNYNAFEAKTSTFEIGINYLFGR